MRQAAYRVVAAHGKAGDQRAAPEDATAHRIRADLTGCSAAEVKAIAKAVLVPEERLVQVRAPNGQVENRLVRRVGTGTIERHDGFLWCQQFYVNEEPEPYYAAMHVELGPDLEPAWDPGHAIRVRLDSSCVPSQFGDLACDCAVQKDRALSDILKAPQGVVLHIVGHDGRGHGTAVHLSTLLSQTGLGCSTIEAARLILPDDTPIDRRSYAGAIAVLIFIGCKPSFTIETLTNNPAKTAAFEINGYRIRRVPIVVPPTPKTVKHFQAKARELGHWDIDPTLESATVACAGSE